MAESRIININGQQIGITGLDQALEEMGPALAGLDDAEAGRALLGRLERSNYVPDTAREAYARALTRELRRFLGQPHEEPPSAGLEVKILGQGCSRCEALTKEVMGLLAEMGLPAAVEHVRNVKEIASYGVMGTPALVINGQVFAAGQSPSKGQLRLWLAKASRGE